MGGQINEDGQMDKKRSWDGEMKGSRKREIQGHATTPEKISITKKRKE